MEENNKSFFKEVKASTFRSKLRKAYWGLKPFEKDYSYSDFKMGYDGNFPEIVFTVRFLCDWARTLEIELTREDRVRALKVFRLVQHQAEGVKCECCSGTGFKKRNSN